MTAKVACPMLVEKDMPEAGYIQITFAPSVDSGLAQWLAMHGFCQIGERPDEFDSHSMKEGQAVLELSNVTPQQKIKNINALAESGLRPTQLIGFTQHEVSQITNEPVATAPDKNVTSILPKGVLRFFAGSRGRDDVGNMYMN